MSVLQFVVVAIIVGLYGLYIAHQSFRKGVLKGSSVAIDITLCYLIYEKNIDNSVAIKCNPRLTDQKIKEIITQYKELWDAHVRLQK